MQHTRPQPAYKAEEIIASWPAQTSRPIVAQTYSQTFETSLKHSNATQNVYFSNFFEWQGSTRERWFFECISNDMLQDKGVFITKKAHNEYFREAFPFQTVTCSLNSFAIQKCSFYLLFRFFIDNQLASSGYQQLVFADKEKRISRLPKDILAKIKKYECDFDDFKK